MKTLFLKLKHWQLFLLFFVVPMVIYVITIIGFMAKMFQLRNQNDFDPSLFSGLFIGIFVMIFIAHGTTTYWNWTIGTQLIKKVPTEIRLKNGFFKFSIIFPFIYFLILPLLMFQVFHSIDIHSHQAPDFNPLIILLFIPFHFFSIFCSFYTIYFVSKTYKTAVLQREITFGDYVGEFFMILFFIVGVWIIQPRVNQLVKSDSEF